MKKFLYILIPSFLISGFLIAEQKGDLEAEVPGLEWYKGYGTDGGDHAHFVMQTYDGGYIMTGESRSRDRQRILVIKNYSQLLFNIFEIKKSIMDKQILPNRSRVGISKTRKISTVKCYEKCDQKSI